MINLSLGASKRDWALAFHDTCDRGYFNNSFIVTAANNVHRDSFPSLFASVTSVASNGSSDPLRFHFNPEPPTEFLARGIDVDVPWLNGSTITTTGNSFAAPHIAAFAALIKAEHPGAPPVPGEDRAVGGVGQRPGGWARPVREREQLQPPVAVQAATGWTVAPARPTTSRQPPPAGTAGATGEPR